MSVYLINRPDRPERLLNSLQQLRKVESAHFVTRVEAYLPEEAKQNRHKVLDRSAYENIVNNQGNTVKIPTWGALACAMSHRECWIKLDRRGEDYGIVVEDDIEIYHQEQFLYARAEAIDLLTKKATQDIPIIILFGAQVVHGNSRKVNDHLDQITGPFTGCHFYFVNWSAAGYLLEKLIRFQYQVDIELGLMARTSANSQQELRIYNYRESGVRQRAGLASDVQVFDNHIDRLDLLPKYLPGTQQPNLILPTHLIKLIVSFLPSTTDNYYSNTLGYLSHTNNNFLSNIYYHSKSPIDPYF